MIEHLDLFSHGPESRVSHLHYHESPVNILEEPIRVVEFPYPHPIAHSWPWVW